MMAAFGILGAVATLAASNSPTSATTAACRLDGLWHGNGTTASILTAFGPPGVALEDVVFRSTQALPAAEPTQPQFYEVAHAALGCSATGCLRPEPGHYHGCVDVPDGAAHQCVWKSGPAAAAAGCGKWAQCAGFWCGASNDIAASTPDWCWARGAAGAAAPLREANWHNATSWIKTTQPNALQLKCTSQHCPWVAGVGSLSGLPGAVKVTLDDGEVLSGLASADCGTITWSDGSTWENQMLQVETVHVVFMGHFDVGFTFPSVRGLLDQYVTNYFPTAFKASADLRDRYPDNEELRFSWTSHPWLIQALLRNETGDVTPEFASRLIQAIKDGDVKYHANPMNMQAEAGERVNMEYGMTEAVELDGVFGQSKKIAASQKDEPGATLGMVKMFADAGVRMLHIGSNDFSTVPALPSVSAAYHGFCNPFIWEDSELPADAGLVMLYCSGYSGPYEDGVEVPNMMGVIPGFKHALAYLMHVDNRGPQTADEVVEGIAAVKRTFPNAKVLPLSTMDAWTTELLAAQSSLSELALPKLVDIEPGSTWVYGIASDPMKMRNYRAVARVAAEWVKAGRVNVSDPRYREFQRMQLKEPEHTWGDGGACEGDYTNKQFYDPTWETCHFGSAGYETARKSWTDQREFVERAVAELGDLPLRAACEAALADAVPKPPSLSDLTKWKQPTASPVAIDGGVTVMFNGSGAIVELKSGGVDHASVGRPIGLFSYATHSDDELNEFGSTYGLSHCQFDCGHCAFAKCGLNESGAISRIYQPVIVDAWSNQKAGRFVFNLSFAHFPGLMKDYGPPAFALLAVNVSVNADTQAVVLDYDLNWFGKKATRMAESLWMTFSPATAIERTNWQMDKLGRAVDPLAVVLNGSRTMHGIWSGVRHSRNASRPAGSAAVDGDDSAVDDVVITSVDAPLVSPGLTFSPTGIISDDEHGQARPDLGWNFNLFNNAWACNFPIFSIDDEQRFRWQIELR